MNTSPKTKNSRSSNLNFRTSIGLFMKLGFLVNNNY